MTAIQTTCQLQFICTEYNYSINHKNRHMMHKSEFYEVQTFCLLKKSKDHRLKLWNHQSMNFRAKWFFFRLLFPIKIFSSISYCVKCKHLQYFGIYSSPGTKLHMAKTFVWNMWCIRFLNWFWIDMSHRRTFLENGKNWYSDHMLLTGPGNHRSLKLSLGFLLYLQGVKHQNLDKNREVYLIKRLS